MAGNQQQQQVVVVNQPQSHAGAPVTIAVS